MISLYSDSSFTTTTSMRKSLPAVTTRSRKRKSSVLQVCKQNDAFLLMTMYAKLTTNMREENT